MKMQNLKTEERPVVNKENNHARSPVNRQMGQFRKWTGQLRETVSGCLERMDAGLSNRKRKWLFCLVLLCWIGFLFYLLGMALRTPPARFVLPFATESSQVGTNPPK